MHPFDLKAAILAKHAQHVVLIHFPLALFVIGVVFDYVAQWTQTYDRQDRLRSRRGGYYSADAADDVVLEYDNAGHLVRSSPPSPAALPA